MSERQDRRTTIRLHLVDFVHSGSQRKCELGRAARINDTSVVAIEDSRLDPTGTRRRHNGNSTGQSFGSDKTMRVTEGRKRECRQAPVEIDKALSVQVSMIDDFQ